MGRHESEQPTWPSSLCGQQQERITIIGKDKRETWSELWVTSLVALPLQDPVTADGPSSQQQRFYPHSSPNTFNGGCRKVLEISRSPQWLWRRRKGKSHSRYHIPFSLPDFNHILYSSYKMTSHNPNPKLLSDLAYASAHPLRPQCHPQAQDL